LCSQGAQVTELPDPDLPDSQAAAIYDLTDVEFVEINGERVRIDNPDPILDTDKAITVVEDQIAPYAFGLNAPQADVDETPSFTILELPETATLRLFDGADLVVGQVLSDAELENIEIVPEQDFRAASELSFDLVQSEDLNEKSDVFSYQRTDAVPALDEEIPVFTATLPEPIRGTALDITAHLTEVEIAPEEPGPRVINTLNLNPGGISDQFALVADFEMPSPTMTVEMLYRSTGPSLPPFNQSGNANLTFMSFATPDNFNEIILFGRVDGSPAGNTLGVVVNGTLHESGFPTSFLLDGQSHRLALSYDSTTGAVKIIYEGVPILSETGPAGAIDGPGTLVFGQEQDSLGGGFVPSEAMPGEIGDIRIWDTLRSTYEIAANSNIEFENPADQPGLVANWRPDPANESVILDALGGASLSVGNNAGFGTIEYPVDPSSNAPTTVTLDQQGDPVEITVESVPDNGTIFYMAPDPALLEHGLVILIETPLAVGDGLTASQLEDLYFRPTKDYFGPAGEFTYRITDDVSFRDLAATIQTDVNVATNGEARDGSAGQTITFDVTPENDAPDVSSLLYPISPRGRLTGEIGASDAEGDAFEFELVQAPSLGILKLDPSGGFTYNQRQAIDFDGADFIEDSFIVRAVETGGLGAASTEKVQVIRIVNPDALADIVFDASNPEVYFEDGNPIKLGGLGTDDRIIGHDGHDGLFGFGGNDTINGDMGEDTISGGDGKDLISGGPDNDTLGGDVMGDTINGDGGDDVIEGGAGNDSLSGDAGNDTVLGGANNDQLFGGIGMDSLDGGSGKDTLDGGEDNDILLGGGSHDRVDGGSGDDMILGGTGDDTLLGQSGSDTLEGGAGADTMDGGAQNDLLDGGSGKDTVNGGDGNDTVLGGNNGDVVNGGCAAIRTTI